MQNEAARPKKRVRDPEAKRQMVLAAALKEFARNGFGGARADRMALMAGVSVGTVFKLFGDKRGIANAVFAQCLKRIQGLIGPAVMVDQPARKAFDQMWEGYTALLFQDPDVLIFFEYQPNAEFLDGHNRIGLAELRGGLAKWIKRHQEAGVLKDASSELLRALAIGSIMRVLRESLDNNLVISKSMLSELKELAWESIVKAKR